MPAANTRESAFVMKTEHVENDRKHVALTLRDSTGELVICDTPQRIDAIVAAINAARASALAEASAIVRNAPDWLSPAEIAERIIGLGEAREMIAADAQHRRQPDCLDASPRRQGDPGPDATPSASGPCVTDVLQKMVETDTQAEWRDHLARHAEMPPEQPKQDFDRGMLARLAEPLSDDDPRPAATVLGIAVVLTAGLLVIVGVFQWLVGL
jgi:hypothetical protein